MKINHHKIIFYDFGFCWKIPDKLFEDVGTIFFDTFEECDNLNALESIDNLTQLMYLSILCLLMMINKDLEID